MIRFIISRLKKPHILFLIFVLFVYSWIATEGREPFWQYHPDGWYNLLVDGFLKGQLNFPVQVDPRLIALSDPYDPAANAPYRLHDMAYYKGKFYLYYGVTPAIVLYLPIRLLTGLVLPDNAAIVFFLFGGLLFAFGTITQIKNTYFPETKNWIMLVCLAVLSFASVSPYILKRTMMYEVASSCGYFFLTGTVYFLVKAVLKPKNVFLVLCVSSLFLGLAVGGRPHFIVTILVFPFIVLKVFKSIEPKNKILAIVCLFSPFFFYMAWIAVYNYLRFENPFEFGWKYILAGHCVLKYKFLNLENINPGFYLYLFTKPIVDNNLPYVHLSGFIPPFIKIPQYYFHIGIVGLFTTIPFVLLTFIIPLVTFKNKINLDKKDIIRFPFFEPFFIFVIGLLISLFLMMGPQVEYRYLGDFATLFIVVASITWIYFNSIFMQRNNIRFLVNLASVLMALISILYGLAFAFEPYLDKIKVARPEIYTNIEKSLKPIYPVFSILNKIGV